MDDFNATVLVIGAFAVYLLVAAMIAVWLSKSKYGGNVDDNAFLAASWPFVVVVFVVFSPVLFIIWMASPDDK